MANGLGAAPRYSGSRLKSNAAPRMLQVGAIQLAGGYSPAVAQRLPGLNANV